MTTSTLRGRDVRAGEDVLLASDVSLDPVVGCCWAAPHPASPAKSAPAQRTRAVRERTWVIVGILLGRAGWPASQREPARLLTAVEEGLTSRSGRGGRR
jgi:hypothetical protein